ncbi:uncharacterized protein K460DRAFT_405839 [Cucurbitaria berberidis CBS 394.84]|uniref:Uncharacterized protein n=1 Tax=Cucurbitaria berberidis CBS 394.84 TaxID=1168544 RepID=A0A9P4L8S6_9PLEO|nr:uncharacterized protein K460DRAFT_405839 [Cucurbitaria berberidis CBS 394.84]KAF1845588.1 hypothetical protein K460DRAFT_405839 [Cucurbitaria berberidis CBS 394.84]
MPLHTRNGARSLPSYLIIIINVLAAMSLRLLLTIATLEEPWGEPDWTQNAGVYVLTKSSRRGVVYLIRFCAAYLVVFSVGVVAGFDWLDNDLVVNVWGPEDLREEVNRGGLLW